MAAADDNYEARKRFIGWFAERFMNISPDAPDHPLKVLARFEATAPSKARKGLDMAINDCVEMAEGFRPIRCGPRTRSWRAWVCPRSRPCD